MKVLAIALIGTALLCIVEALPRYRSSYIYPRRPVPWTAKSQLELESPERPVNVLDPESPNLTDLENPEGPNVIESPDLEIPELPQLPDLLDHPELCKQLQEALCDERLLTCEEEVCHPGACGITCQVQFLGQCFLHVPKFCTCAIRIPDAACEVQRAACAAAEQAFLAAGC